ncbi:phosphate ABC transporter permease subunit PstC [Frigidibacter albus]|uniref:Phosphate transport system permease protein n=1 Tax=Frigidibacter albus TaxID=1465486 RepID=A0A6L8VBS7_9RHOB|nr:phosphate ABC transporter permease subunit PstC [Frigidibacter albus]MZQ87735.1 phosphate ABC transporter permease subunit PstC [Frigidibacter albus]NBE29641.1 phosphate ABC transporter permease subunit PstC [Frigidibacter albus]GGH43626.1 phosphate transport system permease protein [Frigidibacter albus]
MSVGILSLIVLALAVVGFFVGRSRALKSVQGDSRRLHSLPGYYGQTVFLFTAVPAFALMALWLIVQPMVIDGRIVGQLGPQIAEDATASKLAMEDVARIASGLDALQARTGMTNDELRDLSADGSDIRGRLAEVGIALGSEVDPLIFEMAKSFRIMQANGAMIMSVLVLVLAVAGFVLALRRIHGEFRARNVSETFVRWLLIASAGVAILTTVGIVMSLLSETIRFFGIYPISEFFFNLTWNPQFRGGSDLGLIPLLWGTLYISFVAMVVAVPIGIFAAIYTAEYAPPKVRSVVKPVIELIAGIPTVVFGLFALVTVGPFLRDYIAMPLGLGNSGSSVMTAGLVIGVLNIPFISSLTDDIINAVPQSMRDGSYGLGATKSETIRKVVLPAALPGIVGAILLAASRAIGETMIVTMGAGAAAKLGLNPFEAMTTITVKIVSQLTGDLAFDSPETLVAFALGMTLFVITLCLNIFALWIVRKYREQYE